MFTCTFQSLRQARLTQRGRQRQEPLRAASLRHRNVPWEPPRQVGSVKNLTICLSHSLSEIWPKFILFFIPQLAAPKRKRQATADPDSEMTSSSDSDSSSTVNTSTSEDEKDFILPDYLSDELTSSQSSDSEPEEAQAQNLSTGWSEQVPRVDTQFH